MGSRVGSPTSYSPLTTFLELFLILHLGEFRIHHVAFILLLVGAGFARAAVSAAAFLCLGLFGGVHFFAELLRGGRQRFGFGFDGGLVVALHPFLGFLQRGLDGGFFIRR